MLASRDKSSQLLDTLQQWLVSVDLLVRVIKVTPLDNLLAPRSDESFARRSSFGIDGS